MRKFGQLNACLKLCYYITKRNPLFALQDKNQNPTKYTESGRVVLE